MPKKEKPKEEPKTTDIAKIVETKPEEPQDPPKEKIPPQIPPKSEKPKKVGVKIPLKKKRKPRKDKGKQRPQKVNTGEIDTSTKDQKKGMSTAFKAGMVFASIGIFAIAFYAMYKALDKYRKEKKEIEEADEFIEENETTDKEEFVDEEGSIGEFSKDYEAKKTSQ